LKRTFADALEVGDEAVCRKALTDAYAATESFALLADEFIAETFHLLGEKWTCGEIEVYQERRGCEICSRILYEFRRLIPEAPLNAPLALGGSPSGDNYSLPSQLIDLVLRECRWRSMNLGCNLPLSTVLAAAIEHNPKMVWLSVSHLENPDEFLAEYTRFHRQLPPDTMIVLGGRALNDVLRPKMKYTGFCDSMQQLTEFATALHGTRPSFRSSTN
jgi:methanogenic corrinoid protein MtbC1